jgi:hypothetical protein
MTALLLAATRKIRLIETSPARGGLRDIRELISRFGNNVKRRVSY